MEHAVTFLSNDAYQLLYVGSSYFLRTAALLIIPYHINMIIFTRASFEYVYDELR